MRIVAISDTHGNHPDAKSMPEGDVFVHCGDFTNYGRPGEIARFSSWLRELPYEHKIVIAGNHDLSFEDGFAGPSDLGYDVEYLRDSSVVVEGVKFFGAPWTPRFGNWAFMYDCRAAINLWGALPYDIDVLVTHGPSRGILDTVHHGGQAGCPHLGDAIARIRPKLHLHGHIHEDRGEVVLPHGTRVVNCATGGSSKVAAWVGDI